MIFRMLLPVLSITALTLKAQETKKLYDADVLKDESAKKEIDPNEKVCFDKRFRFKARFNGREVGGCFYVNTKIGITGVLPFETAIGGGDCDLEVNEKKFYLIMWGMKGNEYTYFNREERKKQGEPPVLKHYVRTGNTHRSPAESILENKILVKKNGTREYCEGKYKGFEYRSADGKDILFLYGKHYPDQLNAYSYLGANAAGYLKTDKGSYIILQSIHGRDEIKVTGLEDLEGSMACFDPSVFQIYEETKVVEALEATEERKEELEKKLGKDIAAAESGKYPCAGKKAQWTAGKLAHTNKQKEMQESMKNNRVQYTRESDLMEAASKYDPMEPFKLERLETEYKLCVLKSDLDAGRIGKKSDNYAKAVDKAQCWENRIEEFRKLEDGMKAIEDRFRNDRKKMIEEKMKYYREEVMPKVGATRCVN